MKFGFYAMAFGIIVTWICFIYFFDQDVVHQVVYGVAGWQVGGWAARIARHCNS